MTVPHKPDISAKGSWFRRDTQRRRRYESLGTSTPGTLDTSATSRLKRQRRTARNLPVTTQKIPVQSSTTLLTTPELSKQKVSSTPVRYTSSSTPLWLLRLQAFHRNSSIITFLLVVAMLVVYGWTVYSQQLWSQAYRKMQNLQRQERQLTTTNSVLRNKMAQEAEKPSAGLVPPTPEKTIFLPPTMSSSSNQLMPSTTPNHQIQQSSYPLGGY
ncbi:MAG: hypothetical protein QNJ47_24630 [Nostocaceae cyanobacterium]|nr:hypothetical protein [Nostocaceae cyanobacterium]